MFKPPLNILRSLRNREIVKTKSAEIVELVKTGIPVTQVARQFGLRYTTISRIVSRIVKASA